MIQLTWEGVHKLHMGRGSGLATHEAVTPHGRLIRAVLQDGETLTFKTLNIVREQNGMVIADNGLANGEQLITSALEYPTEGMAVKLDDAKLSVPTTQLALKEE